MTPVWIAVIRVWIAIAFLLALCVVMAWFTMPARAQIAGPPMPQLLDGTGCIALSGAHFQLHQGT